MNVASHKQTTSAKRKQLRRARLELLLPPFNTLTVDCGGGGIKSAILDRQGAVISKSIRTPVQYPFTPDDLCNIIEQQIQYHQLPFKRITVGIPGIIRHGTIIYTPHYIRENGPHTEKKLKLAKAWNGLNLAQKFSEFFEVPCKVLNDAEVAAYAVIRGIGNELVLTLGTGLGCAFFVDGELAPHLEFSHAPFHTNRTFDEVLGQKSREKLGDEEWSLHVFAALKALWPVFRWDCLYLGGGNTPLISVNTQTSINHFAAKTAGPGSIIFIENSAGTTGGVAAWN